MQQEPITRRNPIAKSFGAGVNRPQAIPSKRRDRRLRQRDIQREVERDFE